MTYPGNCDKTTSDANAKICQKTGRYYAAVFVTIDSVQNNGGSWTISFKAKDIENNVRIYSGITWGDRKAMWAACPSSLPSKAIAGDPDNDVPGDAPPVGTRGYLYLEKDFLFNNKILSGTPKWPDNLPEEKPFYNTLEVWPSSLVLTCAEQRDADMTVGTIDLLDPALAAPNQTVSTDGTPVSLQLTQRGLKEFGLNFHPWSNLPAAVKIIQGEHKDAHALAAAWHLVAIAVDRAKEDSAARLAKEEDLVLLRKVWPGA